MYNIVQKTMVKGTLLRAVTGSIFEAENNAADGNQDYARSDRI